MNRYYISRFKGLVYGPIEYVRFLKQRLNGDLSRMRTDFAACDSDEAHWEFARRYFAPCQKPSEILAFLEWASGQAPVTVVEVGVARGGTNYLLRNCISSVRQVIGVDYFPRNTRLHRRLHPGAVQIEFVSGQSGAARTLDRVRQLLDGRSIDLLFIDGDHSYEGVMADYRAYLPLMRSGGWIAFHDIVPQARHPDGTCVNGFPVGVDRVWKKVSEGVESMTFIDSPDQFSYGIGVIRSLRYE